MGQSARLTRPRAPSAAAVSVFSTSLGWFGLVRGPQSDVLARVTFGHASAGDVLAVLNGCVEGGCEPANWDRALTARFMAYAAGEPVDFQDVPVLLAATAPFGRQVLAAVRRIPYGATQSYAAIAAACASPRAARAVGNLMACNRLPIVIPCHRVVGAGGRLGGYSAPQGLDMKRRLLSLEGVEGFRTARAS